MDWGLFLGNAEAALALTFIAIIAIGSWSVRNGGIDKSEELDEQGA